MIERSPKYVPSPPAMPLTWEEGDARTITKASYHSLHWVIFPWPVELCKATLTQGKVWTIDLVGTGLGPEVQAKIMAVEGLTLCFVNP